MARALTNDELTLLRKDGRFSKLYLAVLNPNTVYTAQLASLPSSNDNVNTISVTNESGTLSDVKPGMTAYVGSSAGAFDLGMVRIRKAPITGTWYIGLTSSILWQSSAHLTVVDDFDLWAKHAVIDSGALKMDVDVAYSDQHTNFHPVPVLGPHAVAWLEGSTVDVEFDASDSWVPGSTISGYSWSAPGSDSISGGSTATPTITYDAPGCYRVLCTVTAANGKTTTGYRHVFIYDDENMPATVFQLAQCYADYETGGWMFDLTMEDEATLSEIRDRSLVVLFAEDWYGFPPDQEKVSIGPIAGRENIVCVGRVVGQSIRQDRESGFVHFTVQGAHHWLNKIKAFPIELTMATNTPDSWSVIPSMTVDRVLWHILYWHSTVIETMDFFPPEDTRFTQDGKTLASMIWSQLTDIAQSKILASPGVDRFGRLFIEVEPNMVPEGSRSSIPTVMDLTSDDWQEGIDLQRVTVEDVSMITLSSQQVDASGNAVTLYSLSPGHTPLRYGEPLPLDRLLAASQSESNSLAGLALGWHTNPFPDVPVVFLMNNRMFDLWPRQYAGLTVDAADNPRGMDFDGNLIPRRISLFFDADIGYMHPEISFEAESFEQLSTDGDIPDVEDLSIPPLPPISLPNLPDLPPLFPGDPSAQENGPPVVIIVDDTNGILFTKNFDDEEPTDVQWRFWNAGIASADVPFISLDTQRVSMVRCPNGSYYVGIRTQISGSQNRWIDKIYRAPALGSMFQLIIDQAWIDANELTNGGIFGLGVNPNKPEEVAFIAGSRTGSAKHFWIGSYAGWTQGASFSTSTNFTGNLTFGGGKWVWDDLHSSSEFFMRFSADGATLEHTTSSFGQGQLFWHARAGSSAVIFKSKPKVTGSGKFIQSPDNATTINFTIDATEVFGPSVAAAPDGLYLLANWDSAAGERGRSSDGGTSWAGLPNLIFGGTYVFAYAGGSDVDSRWIAARGTVQYSNDWGESWENRSGNLLFLIPTNMRINKIIVPGF